MYIGLHVKCPLFVSDFNKKWVFLSTDFLKILKYQISWKFRLVEAELFHVDRRTDMTKLIVVFRNFADALKKPLSF